MFTQGDFDYKDLKTALEAQDWRKANESIIDVFDHVWADKLHDYITCSDLLIIDRLWTDYSGGHFGFSKQLQIWNELNHNFLAFSIRVGWKVDGKWIEWFDEPKYDITALSGHLPLIFNHHGICQELSSGWWDALAVLLSECINLKQGSQGKKVRELQSLLKEKNCYGGPIDGDFSFRTRNAVKLFQGTQDLQSSGVADLETWRRLLGNRLSRIKED